MLKGLTLNKKLSTAAGNNYAVIIPYLLKLGANMPLRALALTGGV